MLAIYINVIYCLTKNTLNQCVSGTLDILVDIFTMEQFSTYHGIYDFLPLAYI